MSIFQLHHKAMQEYERFVRSFLRIKDDQARAYVEEKLFREKVLWPEPLIAFSPRYALGSSVEALVGEGLLHPACAEVFVGRDGRPLRLYKHQEAALRLAAQGKSFVVTSGTGSGKSLTYVLPAIDYVLRTQEQGLIALFVYPMNALVNSQLAELEALKVRYQEQTGKTFPVTFGRYTGETEAAQRAEFRKAPPHILLTNYMMAELLLTRPEDRELWIGRSLRFLAFDELHTYRGRQGAHVALLARRLQVRAAAREICCIGTSATMVAQKGASPQQRRETVARFATRFFGRGFSAQEVIEEELVPFTPPSVPEAAALAAAVQGWAQEKAPTDFSEDPLACWLEHTAGLQKDPEGGYARAQPKTLSELTQALAEATSVAPDRCKAALQRLLEHPDCPFSFKLHQFISQGRMLYATLEAPDKREFSLEGQSRSAQGKPFFPLVFCRNCGQEYYVLERREKSLFPRLTAYTEEDPTESPQRGYLAIGIFPLPLDTPSHSKPPRAHPKATPQKVWVSPQGVVDSYPHSTWTEAWWQEHPFRYCLACGETFDARTAEYSRLARLSTEGRSSSTTVLALSLLLHAPTAGGVRDKLLSFTDNRQDAALQAGHFNDFVRTSLLRAALASALAQAPPLSFSCIAQAVLAASGLTPLHYANPNYRSPDSVAIPQVEKAFLEFLEYWLYEELAGEWRLIHPGLEQVGLLEIGYTGLDAFCQRDWSAYHPKLASLTDPARRAELLRQMLDIFRKRRAIKAPVMEPAEQTRLLREWSAYLSPFWAPDPEEVRPSTYLSLASTWSSESPPKKYYSGAQVKSLGYRSAVGRLWREFFPHLTERTYTEVMEAFLEALVKAGFLERTGGEHRHSRYRLRAEALLWNRPAHPQEGNAFFRELYLQASERLAQLEAAEHTAQVAPDRRQEREERFRAEPNAKEGPPRLPFLICSPTMELGVNIADLELVHLRNVPPTPANYAQRAGRAGRQGQPGLVFTYCGAYNTHDQYFFRNCIAMVAGTVKPPRIDLSHESLWRTHVHAIWLSAVGISLGDSIGGLVQLDETSAQNKEPILPLSSAIVTKLLLSPAAQEWVKQEVRQVLSLEIASPETLQQWDGWVDEVLAQAPERFDRAFDRWRELYRAALRDFQNAAHLLSDFNIDQTTDDQAEKARRRAKNRIDTLLGKNLPSSVRPEDNDFYPYRYLATEGFLPGYNFPLLPLRAWVQLSEDRGEYISRPRYLAIREFAPGNFLYHEGARWESQRLELPSFTTSPHFKVLCRSCGAFAEEPADICPVCGVSFDPTNSTKETLLEMPSVRTKRRQNITANEEERSRRGYKVHLAYTFPPEQNHKHLFATAYLKTASEPKPVAKLRYVASASLIWINHGSRSAELSLGFQVNMTTGAARPLTSFGNSSSPDAGQVTKLFVQSTQNILLFRPAQKGFLEDGGKSLTLAYALKRGMEQAFELEEGELGVELVGSGEHAAILLYEMGEGGVGALPLLVLEAEALATVARTALELLHFDPRTGKDLRPDCHAACYECLLTYQNQTHALKLNRHLVRDFLLELAQSEVQEEKALVQEVS